MGIKRNLVRLKNKLKGKKEDRFKVDTQNFLDEEKTLTVSKDNQVTTERFVSIRNILLDAKVDDYIKWNYENMVKEQYTAIGEYWEPIELRNFIEKMAVWYELRYPDYEINRLMPGSGQEVIEINNVMFNNNKYINDLFDENSDVRAIDWDEFYNTHTFIQSLPWKERFRFQRVKYRDIVYLDPDYVSNGTIPSVWKCAHLHLTSNGFVSFAEGIGIYSDFKVTNEELKGMHVKEVVQLLKERGLTIPSNNELEKQITNVEKWKKQKEGMLDAVMYRIIERGGNRIGPRRGFLFAKEFGRNKDIPMMYGIDRSDPGLRRFIQEYIKAGGSKDLMCYVGYFSRTNETEKLDTISIQDLILTRKNNASTFYTSEEIKLYQRIVNVISSQIDNEKTGEEEQKQLKLTRKNTKNNNKQV